MKKQKSAFSLLEISVVIIIIGMLSLGIMKGTSIVNSARVASARSLSMLSHISEIPGMVAWYETSMIDSFPAGQNLDVAQISEWRDISPGSIAAQKNKLTRTASSSVIFKMKGINNVPSVQFGSSGSFTLSSFYQGGTTQNTVFVVMRPTSAPSATQMTLLDSASGSSTSSSIGFITNRVYVNFGSSQGTATSTNVPSFVINNDYIIAVSSDNTNTKAYVNDAVTSAGNGTISSGNNQINGLTVGTTKSGGTAFTGYISEIIIFNRVLSIDERKSVMGYLSKKYKIAVTGV